MPRDPVLLSALLLTDPPGALRRLRASNAETARVDAMQRGPAAPADDTPEAVRRWRATVLDAADDLIGLWRLRRGTEPPWKRAVAESRARGDPVTRAELAVDGTDIAAAGVPAGPPIGKMLDLLLDKVLGDPSLNTKAQLSAIVREHR